MTVHHLVNDVTQLNPVRVMAIVAPTSVEDVQEALRRTSGPVSIGGGRFSMGGQTASAGSLHFDMRTMNQIVSFSPQERTIRVQAGVRWCDIQKFIDPHGLSIKIMQTYANFTVGGALGVNCHGRYVGLGPLVLSVRSIKLVLHDGTAVEASRTQHAELFFGAIGGYGSLGIAVEIELDLAENKRVQRVDEVMPLAEYGRYFKDAVRGNARTVFHNADIYAPHYGTVRAVSWVETEAPVTTQERLQAPRRSYPLHQYFLWAMSETPFGKERREKLIDPLLYLGKKVHWRNYEAGYDVAELEPPSRSARTYVLQEYFVPVERLTEFVPKMAEILNRHKVNALNISIRHAMPDKETLLNWAPTETFAFVLYHKQRTRENAKSRVGVWTRELIDAVLSIGGTYYLPYQPHGTVEQFHRAYPKARQLFALKREVDPHFRFTNVLWNKYYKPWLDGHPKPEAAHVTEFHQVFGPVHLSDAFYRFLQSVFRTLPEDRFHALISEACRLHDDEEAIYRHIQRELGGVKPIAADLRFALPSLFKQKAEMTRQTLQVLGKRRQFKGYLEIGSKGRYYRGLNKSLTLTGPALFVDEKPPSFSPVDIMERGQFAQLGQHIPLSDFAPLPIEQIPDGSVDLVTCLIGLHHMTVDRLTGFLKSIHRVLSPGGAFVVRDHDVRNEDLRALVSLAHTVFNAGLGETWETNQAELRFFESADTWVKRLDAAGFDDSGHRVLQDQDPTDNVLFCFIKRAETGAAA
ncbi:MAG TPA: FAD-binding protein [Burkholderiaceae bacterium]|jgi:FAD/FMN-containing dehydrogenase